MAFDSAVLQTRHHLTHLAVTSSTQISSRTSAILAALERASEGEQEDASRSLQKTPLVILTAPTKATNKLVSIVEIAKRDLRSRKVKVWQYTQLTSNLVDIPRRRPTGNADGEGNHSGDGDDDDDEHAFEILGHAQGLQESATKKRNVPVLTIYLATASIRELKNAFGEQT